MKRYNEAKKAKVVAAVQGYLAAGLTQEMAAKKARVTWATYKNWTKSAPKARRAKSVPELLTLPIPQAPTGNMAVMFGPTEEIQKALTLLAQMHQR